MLRVVTVVCAVALAASLPIRSDNADKLPAMNIDVNQTSVSGLSSGAFFAVQMHVAFSDFIVGAGIFAGGPYDCAKASLETAEITCMNALMKPSASTYEGITDSRAKDGSVDPTNNMEGDNVFLFSGTQDTTVKQTVMDSLDDYYKHYISSGQVVYENSMAAAHTQPTDDPANKNSCTTSSSPYLSNCNYDGAGKALNTIYSNLKPRNEGTLSGKIISFDQNEFFGMGESMDSTGYAFVPADCASGKKCRLHISFHGCEQYYGTVGDAYVAHSGYNKWADTNDIVVLYPQTKKSTFAPSNPNGCWDWWGFAGNDYDEKSGKQMSGVKKMIDRVSSGHSSLPAPKNLAVVGTTNTTVSLSWDSVTGASSYQISRDGSVVGTTSDTKFENDKLATGTKYTYTVAALDSSKSAGPSSAPVDATTKGPAPPLAPPSGLKVASTTNTSITVSWDSESGASGYKVYVDGAKTGEKESTASHTDDGFQPETQHTFTVTAVDADGKESAPSAPVTGTTASSYKCQEFDASNYAHVQAGRAKDEMGHAHALGSDADMGLDNTFYKTTLAETKEGYYIIGNCPSDDE